MVRKRSVLDQIPILWKVKMFRGEGGNGLTLRTSLVFLFELLISSLLTGGMGLAPFLFLSFFACLSSFVFRENDPYSMRIKLLEWSISWIDHLRWIGSLWRFLVFVVKGIVWRRWVSIPGVGN